MHVWSLGRTRTVWLFHGPMVMGYGNFTQMCMRPFFSRSQRVMANAHHLAWWPRLTSLPKKLLPQAQHACSQVRFWIIRILGAIRPRCWLSIFNSSIADMTCLGQLHSFSQPVGWYRIFRFFIQVCGGEIFVSCSIFIALSNVLSIYLAKCFGMSWYFRALMMVSSVSWCQRC